MERNEILSVVNPKEVTPTDTLLIVEDEKIHARLMEIPIRARFPNKKIVVVPMMSDAIEILGNYKTAVEKWGDKDEQGRGKPFNVVGIILDNGFPLIPNGPRVGTADKEKESPEQLSKKEVEGSAGIMFLRYLRTGSFGLKSEDRLAEYSAMEKKLEAYHEMHASTYERYKHVPVVWNSADIELGKLNAAIAAANGVEIDPQEPRYRDKTLPFQQGKGGEPALDEPFTIAPNTLAVSKGALMAVGGKAQKAVFDFLEEHMKHPDPRALQGAGTQIIVPEQREKS